MPITAPIIAKQPSEHLPAVTVVPIPVGPPTSSGTTTVLGIAFRTDNAASGYYNYQIKQTFPAFGTEGVIVNKNPEICTLVGDTLVRVVNGTAFVDVEKNGFKTPLRLTFSSTSSTASVWTGFTGTTTSSTQSDPLLNLLISGKTNNYYPATWPLPSAPVAGSTFPRNPSCWAAGIDFTFSAIATGLGGNVMPYNSGANITPQHGVGVKHWGQGNENMGPGQKVYFVDASGIIHERTVVQRYIHPTKDMIVYRYDTALPAGVKPIKLPGAGLYDVANKRLYGMGWQINQQKQIGIVGFDKFTIFPQDFEGTYVYFDNEFLRKTDPDHRMFGKDPFIFKGVQGDSGGAIGGIYNGERFLVSLFTGPGSGLYYSSAIAPELNAIIAALDAAQGIATGYQVGVLDIVSAFDPLSLSPAMWLDASDATTLYDAVSGGALVTGSGAVARWQDKSGNARHATQATLAARPLRQATVLNGKAVLRFDGLDDVMGHGLSVVGDNTVFIVARSYQATTDSRVIFSASAPNNPLNCTIREDPPTNQWSTFRSSGPMYSGQSLRGSPKIISVLAAGSSGSLTTNGTLVNFTAGGFYQDANERRGIGGNGFNNSENIACDIAEILVFPTALSPADRAAVETYLNAKWACY